MDLSTDKERKIARKRREMVRRKENKLVVLSGVPITRRLVYSSLFLVPLILIALYFDIVKCEHCDAHHSISANVEHKH